MKIVKGDLVHLPRRRRTGLGTAIAQIDDVAARLHIEDPIEWVRCLGDLTWTMRQITITDKANELFVFGAPRCIGPPTSVGREDTRRVVAAYCYFNLSPFKKYKNRLTLVKWHKPPSAYATDLVPASTAMEWYPTDWLQAL